MKEFLLASINTVRIYMIITFLWILYNSKGRFQKYFPLLLVLVVGLINEFCLSYLAYTKVDSGLNTSIYVVLHNVIWLWIFYKSFHRPYILKAIILYAVFSLINLFFIEGTTNFNYYPFLAGAFLYVLLFLVESLRMLHNESILNMHGSTYLMLCAPLLFFLGFSLLFGFRDKAIFQTVVFGSTTLFSIISLFVNLVYYSLINYCVSSPKIEPHER
ncbi:hypothetical protein HUK80_14860 [Flavobacterium sp. MAH-1]|uniref:Uncharacterized protein n=1 Tax=Flavobacterium agri TaxID=2743471 RepID=A0A7Y8Y470_9FLAO|nr:hypothetical protein [Flavobacterium agri]NUY82183.1 hypothetical protein [Flavobacterium agri]NYA72207.1 hypothetical protein [Flavobacterium agri]